MRGMRFKDASVLDFFGRFGEGWRTTFLGDLRLSILLGFAAAGAWSGTFADEHCLVRNAGFEEGSGTEATGWYIAPGKYFCEERAGRSGTRALAYVNTDDRKIYTVPSTEIKLEKDAVYHFGAWVKVEGLTSGGDGAIVCVEWYDGQKYVGGAYAEGVKGTTGDWVKIEGFTPRIPDNVTRAIVAPVVRKGSLGKAWFDDVFVERFVPRPVKALLCDAYRDEAAAGTVTFCAALDLEPSAVRSHRGEFCYVDAQGREQVVTAPLSQSAARVSLSVSDLRVGRQSVHFVLSDGSGKVVGESALGFMRLPEPAPRKVWIDAFGRTIVDGKPYFPMGTFWTEFKSKEDVELYAKSPFNCIMPYWGHRNPDIRKMLDLCAAKGIRVIPNLKDFWDYGDPETAPARTMDFVNQLKDHPALLAWYVVDESPLSKLPQLRQRRDLVARLDPDHPTWGCFYQYDQILDYLPSCDVIGTDPYPIGQGSIDLVMTSTGAAALGARGCRALWQVPQMFDWAAYRKDDPKARPPTLDEMRNMGWQCIANGANGLVWYSFFDVKAEPRGVSFASRWADCCRVAEEILRHKEILLAPKSRLVNDAALGKLVSARLYSLADYDALLVVNASASAQTVALPMNGLRGDSAQAIMGDAPVVEGGDLKISLKGLGCALIRINDCKRKGLSR